MKPFLYYRGLKKLAKELRGTERIYLGIRPYGFHCGNMVSLVVYPILLCQELLKLKKVPRFKIYVFINDWEQDRLAGPDVKMHPFNIHPLKTTFQYTFDPSNPTKSIVDFWEPEIMRNICKIKELFPLVTVQSVRNSQMKQHSIMKRCLTQTLNNPQLIAEILLKFTNKKILSEPIAYAMAVCPDCKIVRGQTQIIKKIIHHYCSLCGKVTTGDYRDFDYWFYHKPLALPRIEICKIDLCITGADHHNEGDFKVRQELMKAYKIKTPPPKTLYTPVVYGFNGQVMGKSKGNAVLWDFDELLNLVSENLLATMLTIKQAPMTCPVLRSKNKARLGARVSPQL